MFALLGLFLNWPMAIFALVLLAIAAAIWFTPTLGPTYLLTVVTDARAWIACGAIVGLIVLWHSSQTIQKQQQQINTQAVVTKSSTDSKAVVTDIVKKKQSRVVQQQNEQNAISTAPTGDQTDALMDVIAKENGNAVSNGPAPASVPTPLPKPKQ